MAGLGLIAINEGTQPTFVRGQSTSILDIALATERIAGCIATFSLLWWPMVLDGWCLKKLDLGGFKSEMHNQILSRNVKTANDLRRVLTIACNASMPRKTEKRNRGPVYWWTHEIACLSRIVYTKRNIPNHVREICGLSYRQDKKELRLAIKASKLSCWRN
nr:unnamed protein product [Callosobruchus analis]